MYCWKKARSMSGYVYLRNFTIRRAPIGVVSVVVVEVATCVDIPCIVRIATIRTAQAHILRLAYILL